MQSTSNGALCLHLGEGDAHASSVHPPSVYTASGEAGAASASLLGGLFSCRNVEESANTDLGHLCFHSGHFVEDFNRDFHEHHNNINQMQLHSRGGDLSRGRMTLNICDDDEKEENVHRQWNVIEADEDSDDVEMNNIDLGVINKFLVTDKDLSFGQTDQSSPDEESAEGDCVEVVHLCTRSRPPTANGLQDELLDHLDGIIDQVQIAVGPFANDEKAHSDEALEENNEEQDFIEADLTMGRDEDEESASRDDDEEMSNEPLEAAASSAFEESALALSSGTVEAEMRVLTLLSPWRSMENNLNLSPKDESLPRPTSTSDFLDHDENLYQPGDVHCIGLLIRDAPVLHAEDEEEELLPSEPPSVSYVELDAEQEAGFIDLGMDEAGCTDLPEAMLWSEEEAYQQQVLQFGTSACGPTAVLNVLRGLGLQHEFDRQHVIDAIPVSLRAESAPVPEYLFSRSCAGTTAEQLLDGIYRLTSGRVRGRFFPFFPRRRVHLAHWLAHWIQRGAVPLALLNLQRAVAPGWHIPDAWHHQMVHGVSARGIHLTNPLELVPPALLMEQLSSPSLLLVRREDVLKRWSPDVDLTPLATAHDPRWPQLNVLGQVVNVLRESFSPKQCGYKPFTSSHVRIPAAYHAGMTLYALKGTEVLREVLRAPELPLVDEKSGSVNCVRS